MNLKSLAQNLLMATFGGALAITGFYIIYEPKETTKVIQSSPKIQLSNNVAQPSTAEVIPSFKYAAQESVNSVVHIKTIATQTVHRSYDPIEEFFFGRPSHPPKQQISGSGSGVIISEDGYIATNNHVVNGATQIEVTLNDKRTYSGKIIGTDPTTDLALIKVEEKGLKPIYYGNSDEIQIGEWVLAVGNPFNLTSTVTAGIVSAKARNINILKEDYAIESFIQTDAAVNPGNSGGALVNQNGELIGINTAIASNTGSYTGYSFAVPVNMVKKIMNDLAKFGTVQRALLGVQIRDINQDLANERNIDNLNGVYISNIIQGGAADEAGLKDGDIIRRINDAPIKNPSQLQEKIGQHRPGDKITIQIERDGEFLNKTIVLKNKLGTTEAIAKEVSFLGAKLGDVSKEEIKNLNIDGGVKIESLKNGKFLREGIKKGFIITKINNKKVKSPEELINALKSAKGGVLIEGIYPSGAIAYYGFGM